MKLADDLTWMRRALHLAALAEGETSPNPLVGAVIVHNGTIIGEGYHLKAGLPHAEVVAVNAVQERGVLPASTLYVNLEPCSHYGRTPPCTDLIISSGIGRVVIGTTDTNPEVAGRGIRQLREAGVEVITGVAEKESRDLNRRFFTWHEKKRPYVILKWARSADGFLDRKRNHGEPAGPNWITGLSERVLVHRWRAAEDAILVGGATIRNDNPSLTVRLWGGNNPVRVVVSRSGELGSGQALFDDAAETLLFTCNENILYPGVKVLKLKSDENYLPQVLRTLFEADVQSLFVEGGAAVIKKFIQSGEWDEARRFTGMIRFKEGIPDPFPEFISSYSVRFEKSILDFMYHFHDSHV